MKSFLAGRLWLASLLALTAAAPHASAKPTGMNLPCINCHEGASPPQLSVMLSAPRVEPGQDVTITVTAKHPTAMVGGVLVDSHEKGAFELIDMVGTHFFVNPEMMQVKTQVTQAMPIPYANGQVTFAFKWKAPTMTGPVKFDAWTNAANGNGMAPDDSAKGMEFGVGVGCDGAWYYTDADQDGEGPEVGKVFSCTPMAGYITTGGDCADNDPKVNTKAVEVCNQTDDNCNGEIDEGFTPALLVSDKDGDGHGASDGLTMFGCPPIEGYSTTLDDCNDRDATVHPGAAEVANGRDDDCNGKVDDVSTTPTPTGGTGGTGTGGTSAGGTGTGGTAGTAPQPPPTTPGESGGCSVGQVQGRDGSWFVALAGIVGLVTWAGRRSRRRAAA